ncbi:MAG: hypothetical protein F6J90_40630 [Moorea sp. SIOASIH]|nr:hypothetical protein [Moorena sp. SIOASIH]NEO42293.1 hypothetical protein [Moorena sp. SIOASIH]NEO92030.1 hypothetical protein [Moorena sp. SIO3G5]
MILKIPCRLPETPTSTNLGKDNPGGIIGNIPNFPKETGKRFFRNVR